MKLESLQVQWTSVFRGETTDKLTDTYSDSSCVGICSPTRNANANEAAHEKCQLADDS